MVFAVSWNSGAGWGLHRGERSQYNCESSHHEWVSDIENVGLRSPAMTVAERMSDVNTANNNEVGQANRLL